MSCRYRRSSSSTRSIASRCSAFCGADSAPIVQTTPSRRRSSEHWRAYGRLEHGQHLRAWVLTIAQNVALDTLRRTRPTSELVETGVEDARPAHESLADLTEGLSPKERAAVLLRYGYDLSYDQIASALGSSPDAARQAASTGVRRLRRRSS